MGTALTLPDMQNATGNVFYGLGHFVVGGAVAGTINYLAHQLFGAKEKTWCSYGIQRVSIIAGYLAGIYLSSRSTLITFTVEKMFQLAVVQACVAVASKLMKNKITYLPFVEGALIGSIGPDSLSAISGIGAVAVVDFSSSSVRSSRDS